MKTLASTTMAIALALLLVAPALAGGDAQQTTYEVTIENLTDGQPFSPPVAATHDGSVSEFEVGAEASVELEAIAEDGNPKPMFMRLKGLEGVTEAVNVGHPLTPQGIERMMKGKTITNTATFRITADPGDMFSIATMLICTNDGFTGLDGVELPESGSVEYTLESYDAGTENNTEQSQDIVDPCSKLGAVKLPGDPDGNVGKGPENVEISTVPEAEIQAHEGIRGVGELTVETHGWTDPVAKVTITRLDQPGMPDTGAGGMAGSGLPLGGIAAGVALLAAGGYGLLRRRLT